MNLNTSRINSSSKDTRIDLTHVRPYGDTLNDGKVQVSFTFPIKTGKKAIEAAKLLVNKMGLEDPNVVHMEKLDTNFTFFIIYGSLTHSVDYTQVKVKSPEIELMSIDEINYYIRTNFNRKIIVIGATSGTDAHSMGLDAIMNFKGYAGHHGLESIEMLDTYNLGSQVANEIIIRKVMELHADVLLISQTVTQKDIHLKNLTNLVDLLEAENIRDQIILICGGSRIDNDLAKELGYDAGFGPGSTGELVATYFIKELSRRKKNEHIK